MTNTTIEEDLAKLKDLKEAADQRSEAASAWSSAAMLTLSGGALIGLINAGSRVSEPFLPSMLFLAALIVGVVGSAIRRVVYNRMHGSMHRFAEALRSHDRGGSQIDLETAASRSVALMKWLKHAEQVPHLMSVLSLILFGIGGWVALARIDTDQVHDKARCLVLQQDMLSAIPKRSDSRELFVALQCKSAGAGAVYVRPRLSAPAVPNP